MNRDAGASTLDGTTAHLPPSGDLRNTALLCVLLLLSICLLSACSSVSSRRVAADGFNYNEAISTSIKEQLLGNIVRVRYFDFPSFLAVSSVVTSYSYSGGLGVHGNFRSPNNTGGTANIGYTETPTISYTPLSGKEFNEKLFRPIDIAEIISLGQSGWPVDLLLFIGLEAINDIKNMSFSTDIPIADLDPISRYQTDALDAAQFKRVTALILQLLRNHMFELLGNYADNSLELIVRDPVPPAHRAQVEEFRSLLDLDPSVTRYTITRNQAGRKNDEIAIDTRSLFAIMLFLAHGVVVPSLHHEQKMVFAVPSTNQKSFHDLIPFRVFSQRERPAEAFVSVNYNGYWFYISHTDLMSKTILMYLLTMLQLNAQLPTDSAPVLTLPASR